MNRKLSSNAKNCLIHIYFFVFCIQCRIPDMAWTTPAVHTRTTEYARDTGCGIFAGKDNWCAYTFGSAYRLSLACPKTVQSSNKHCIAYTCIAIACELLLCDGSFGGLDVLQRLYFKYSIYTEFCLENSITNCTSYGVKNFWEKFNWKYIEMDLWIYTKKQVRDENMKYAKIHLIQYRILDEYKDKNTTCTLQLISVPWFY